MRSKWFYVFCAVVVYIIYGGSYLCIKLLSASLGGDVLQLLSFRFGTAFAAALLLCAAGVYKPSLRGKKPLPLLVTGLVYPIGYYLCETYGLQNFPSGTASVLMATVPVIAALLAMGLFKEFPTLLQWISIGVSIAGAVVLNLGGGMTGGSAGGFVLILLTVLMCALQSVTVRWARSSGYTPGEITLFSVGMGAAAFIGLSVAQRAAAGTLSGYFAPLADARNLLCILYLGVIASVGAVTVMNQIFSSLPIAVACGVSGVASVVAVLVGVLVLKESFSPVYLVGMAAVLAGSFGVSRFQRWSGKKENAAQPKA